MMISSCTGALYWTPTRPILSSNWVWFLILVGIESSKPAASTLTGMAYKATCSFINYRKCLKFSSWEFKHLWKMLPCTKKFIVKNQMPSIHFFESLVGPLLTFILRVWENNFQDGCYCFTPKRTPWCISKNHIPA